MSKLTFDELTALHLLLSADGIGPVKLQHLLAKFHTFEAVFNASEAQLQGVEGISKTLTKTLKEALNRKTTVAENLRHELNELDRIGARMITLWDNDYPDLLKNIYSPPMTLCVLGDITEADDRAVAIVGTRHLSPYGKAVAAEFASGLAAKGFTVVSGLARGIDSIAHRETLRSGGRTLAVLGSGLGRIYPAENKKLAEEIAANGAVITEYGFHAKPDAQNFPRRNRIISGLSLGSLIVESNTTGGALLTARFANDQGREIFAVPGNIGSPQSFGTNMLIQRGEAKLVRNVDDILVELNVDPETMAPPAKKEKPPIPLNLFEEKLVSVLSNEPEHIDAIAIKSGMPSSDCLVHLLNLEFKGAVRQLPGKNFVLEN